MKEYWHEKISPFGNFIGTCLSAVNYFPADYCVCCKVLSGIRRRLSCSLDCPSVYQEISLVFWRTSRRSQTAWEKINTFNFKCKRYFVSNLFLTETHRPFA
jgi:hypothetical protein